MGRGGAIKEVTREGALNSHKYNARVLGLLLAFGVMLATEGWAQVEIGSNTSVSMSGDLGFGYNGEYGNKLYSQVTAQA